MILVFLIGFISGIAIGSFVHFSISIILFLFFVSVICFVYVKYLSKEEKIILILISIFITSLALGLFRITFSNLYKEAELQKYVGKEISAEALIIGEPDVREGNTKLTIKLLNIDNQVIDSSEKVLITVPLYPEYKYGDKIKLSLTLEEPQNIESDGRVFDYKNYLRVRGIWFTSRFSKVQFISSGHGAIIIDYLYKIKSLFTKATDNALPEPESSFLGGILLGAKQSLGKDLLMEFQRTGTSHVVVLSGYNIAIVAESIMALLRFLPNTFSFFGGVIGILLFTLLSGGGASAWRAAIMVLVALSAKKLNRDFKASRALGLAVILMLTPNPLLLAFDPSFQLSILATTGLVFVSPIISKYFIKIPQKLGNYFPLREIIQSTIATQIIVLPFLLYNTGILSIISLPVNILILGFIPLTMLLGFLTGLFGLFSLYLSYIPAIFTYILLRYELLVVHLGSSLSFGAIKLPAFSPAILLSIYLIIFVSLFFKDRLHSLLKSFLNFFPV
jgi:competence protein ComEC